MRVPYDYEVAGVLKVVDGDTVDLVLRSDPVDVGFRVQVRGTLTQRIRLLGVDTPERGRPGFNEAGTFAVEWLALAFHEGRPIRCRTEKSDSFGRYLGEVYLVDTGETLAEGLIEAGLGTPA